MKRTNTLEGTKCTACDAFARFKGIPYCKKHYMQMYHKGKITKRTIYPTSTYYMMITLSVLPMTKRVMRQLESRLI